MKTSNDYHVLYAIRSEIEQGTAYELVEICDTKGAVPRDEGAYMIVDADGIAYGTIGGGEAEYEAMCAAKQLIAEKKNDILHFQLNNKDTHKEQKHFGVCGGNVSLKCTYLQGSTGVTRLNEIIDTEQKLRPRAVIFGAGHVALQLSKVLNFIGFEYVIYDDRPEFANSDRFPDAQKVIAAPFENIASQLEILPSDYVIVMTRGHECDYIVERQIMQAPPQYVGEIGSHTKLTHIHDALCQDDGVSQEAISHMFAPVGIPIGAETPEEIAISIAAELIAKRAHNEQRKRLVRHPTIVYGAFTNESAL